MERLTSTDSESVLSIIIHWKNKRKAMMMSQTIPWMGETEKTETFYSLYVTMCSFSTALDHLNTRPCEIAHHGPTIDMLHLKESYSGMRIMLSVAAKWGKTQILITCCAMECGIG